MRVARRALAFRGAGIVLALLGALLFSAVAQAATITPTRFDDPPGAGSCPAECSLRQAIAAAGPGGTVLLQGGTYQLTLGSLAAAADVTIAGPGAAASIISAGGKSEILTVASGTHVSVSGVTLTGGLAPASGTFGGNGGAIENRGVLALSGVALVRNVAAGGTPTSEVFGGDGGSGGAIMNWGLLTVVGGTFVENTSHGGSTKFSGKTTEFEGSEGTGGAIDNRGALVVSGGTSFSANIAEAGADGTVFSGSGGEGGAITNNASAHITDASFNANTAAGASSEGADGGAIDNLGTLRITEGTLSNNVAGTGASGSDGGEGGAIMNHSSLHIAASTLVGNKAAGNATANGEGGAVQSSGAVTIENSSLDGNSVQGPTSEGGAIESFSSLAISGSTLNGNTGAEEGGAIESFSSLTIQASTLSGNSVAGKAAEGGAIESFSSLTIEGSTLNANTSANEGGAIESFTSLEATNATIAGNSATKEGGGIENYGAAALANVTLAGNGASATHGGNVENFGPLLLHDTIVAQGTVTGGSGGENCAGPGEYISLGFNLEDQNQCTLTAAGDKTNVGAGLGPLAANGGPTQTLALLAGSPAIDAGDSGGCTNTEGEQLTVDQRGTHRPQGSRCDIGAYELVQTPSPAPPPTPFVHLTPVLPAPAITGLRVLPSPLLAAPSGPTIARKQKPGATISYRDSQVATTSFTVLRSAAGVRSGRRCIAPPRHKPKHRKFKRCTRLVSVGGFAHVDAAGANNLRFSGRVHGRKLPPGGYTLTATPAVGRRVGRTVSTRFQIKR